MLRNQRAMLFCTRLNRSPAGYKVPIVCVYRAAVKLSPRVYTRVLFSPSTILPTHYGFVLPIRSVCIHDVRPPSGSASTHGAFLIISRERQQSRSSLGTIRPTGPWTGRTEVSRAVALLIRAARSNVHYQCVFFVMSTMLVEEQKNTPLILNARGKKQLLVQHPSLR